MVKVRDKTFSFDQFLPDFRLTRPEEMHTNPNHDRKDPGSLVVPVLDRLPFQKPMPAYNPRIEKNVLLERRRKVIGEMLQTDRLFHRISRELAVANDIEKRIEARKVEVETQFDLFGRRWVDAELMRRVAFYRKVADIVVSRKARHEKARAFQLAAFEFLSERSTKRAIREKDRLDFLIQRAAVNAKAWLEFRTDDLYVKTGDHTFRRLKGHGQPRENVTGDLHWELAKLVTEMNEEWRLGNLRVTTPNGAIQRTDSGGGKLIEEVTAELQLPLLRERFERHDYWHATNYLIATPNNSLMHAKMQGAKPEAATAALAEPVKDLKTAQFELWHDRNYLIETPNHSLQPAFKQGSKPEAATAALALPIREEKTAKFQRWHDNGYLVETPNHSLQPATRQGSRPEAAHAALALPVREEKTAKFQHWHDRHFYVETPNHSLQPATRQGDRVEAANAELALPVREEKTAAFRLWHEGHKFQQTPNGGYAPLLHSRKTIEFVTGEFTAERKSDVTQNHLERRLANLYAPSDNGTWRRLARIGQSVEHVSADVKEQNDQAKASADSRADGKRVLAARKSLKEIHKNLAAHEPQRSALHEHALKRPESLAEKAPAKNDPDPVPGPSGTKKAS